MDITKLSQTVDKFFPIAGPIFFILSVFACLVAPDVALSDSIDIGGFDEEFKAGGDQRPPNCQLEFPRAATSAFFIQWDCTDDVSPPEDITTELWFLKNGASVPKKIASFLGFPASVQFTAENLEATSVAAGLPAAFRLVARDRAGIATISPFVIVSAQDNSVDDCTVSLVRSATQSTGDTTGTPATSILLSNVDVATQQVNSNSVRIFTEDSVEASPCEIDAVCDDADDNELSFSINADLSSTSEVTGSFTLSPGTTSSTLTGTATVSNSILSNLSLDGTTTIDGVSTAVSISCSQN